MNKLTATDYFDNEYISFSVYDNVRKISSYVDGLKNSTRKVLFTLLETNCDNFLKVSNLGPRVQDYSQYLHGSLENGIVNMTQDYVGSGNNLPLLKGDGNFGTAFIPQPAAARYIFAKTNPEAKKIFLKDDNVNLNYQMFEGDRIEPKFYMPVIPLILANQCEGMSIGFAQKILPRDPKQLIKWVQQKAEGKRITADLTPYWNNQTFTVSKGEVDNQWIIEGKFERLSSNRIAVTALPVGYTLKSYTDHLDKLVDQKAIRDYDDLSDQDVFHFEIYVDKAFVANSDEWLMTKLKLSKKISENYTCIDENNNIVVFESVKDLLEAWWQKRVEHNQIRKDYVLLTLQAKIDAANVKAVFIQGVLDEKIELRGQKEDAIVTQAEEYDEVLKGQVTNLLKLPMKQLTEEEIKKLKALIKELSAEKKEYQKLTLQEISLRDLQALQ